MRTQGVGRYPSASLAPQPRDKQLRAVHSVESLSFPPPQVSLLPANITCVNPHSVQPPLHLGIKLDPVKLLPPAHVLAATISNKTVWFWTPGCISNLGKCDLLVVSFSSRDLQLQVQSFRNPFPLFSSLGFQTSNFFKQSLHFCFFFSWVLGIIFQGKMEKDQLYHVQILSSIFFSSKKNSFIISLNIKCHGSSKIQTVQKRVRKKQLKSYYLKPH